MHTLEEAKVLANRGGCFIIERGGVFLLYRRNYPRNIRIGKSESVAGTIRLVKKVCNVSE